MSAVHKLITNHLDIWTAADTEKKSGRGRASGNANSVYGIKKLRELILELAVRGKLVPQDPNDEPASILLEKIFAQKSELTLVGRQKKETQSPTIKEDEKRFTLPSGWEWIRFGDALINRDAERKPIAAGQRQDRQGLYDYYGASGVIDKIDEYLFDKPLLLIGEDGANLVNRSTPIAFIARGKYWVNNHAHVLDGVSEDYLRYIELFVNAIDLKPFVTGTAQPKMNQAKMNSIVLAIPPEEEQHRIVAKVDELMALCDQLEAQHNNAADAHEQLVSHLLSTLTQSQDAADFNANWQRIATHFDTLFTTESSIDALKQTLLQLAVMGKLVPQDPNDEPASELLKRIQAEKAKLIAEGKIKKDKPIAKISADEIIFDAPIGWEFVRKAEIFRFLNGYAFKSEWFQPTGVKLLRNVNISHGRAEWGDVAHISNTLAKEFEEYSLRTGDMVLSLDRPIIATGLKFALITESDIPCLLLQRVAKISGYSQSVVSDYLSIWLQSPFFTNKIDPGRSNGVPHISTTQVSNMVFALPPVAEQHRIIAKVNELSSLCDQLKKCLFSKTLLQKRLAEIIASNFVD